MWRSDAGSDTTLEPDVSGGMLYEVKEILGHTDIKTTMRYAHLERTEISKKAKQVLDAMNV